MSYASRKKIKRNVLTIVTWFLVVVNLIPILWMVYCGVKDNQEILAGKTAPGRRQNEIVFLRELPTSYLAGTADGGITWFNKDNLQKTKHLSLETFSTSFLLENKTLWALSSNRGLASIDVENFSVTKKYSVDEIAKSHGKAWNTLWVNEVATSSLAKSHDVLYIAYDFKGYPAITTFTPSTGVFAPVPGFSLKETGPISQIASTGQGDSLAMISSNGIFFLRTDLGLKGKSILANAQLPANPGKVSSLDSNRLLITADSRAYIYDVVADSVLTWLERPENGGVITVASRSEAKIWLGDSRGVSSMDISGSHAIDSGLTEAHPTAPQAWGKDISASRVTALLPLADGKVLVGGPNGNISIQNSAGVTLLSGQAPKAAFYIHWRNYVDLWRNIDFGLYLKNSFIVCLSVMVIAMVLASMGGYALARYNFPGKSSFGYSVLATQMVPGIMLLLPLYLMFVNITQATGIIVKGTYMGLILTYAAYFVPFSIWILRGFFASLPKELEEAALVDGCGPFQAFFRIIIPSALPGIIATGVYVFLSAWDELMFAWVLTSEKTYTIPVGIRLFVGNFQNRYDLMMAAATVSTLPVMFLFFLMQKQIVSGLTAGAVKE
jgi:multiple sugar transport system permease protein